MSSPLVSIICLCHNHEPFIPEALDSVLAQDYPYLEVILVDDGSKDGSAEILEDFAQEQDWQFLRSEISEGNCRAFNRALVLAKGKYLIDFATDDVMLPQRISRQVEAFEALGAEWGMVFTNAEEIDEQSNFLRVHASAEKDVPSGDVFSEVVARYFICPPSMMFRTEMLRKLGGYDEQLAYEDFDVWVRGARDWKFYYLDEILTQRRRVGNSLSTHFRGEKCFPLLESTYQVCLKAKALCRDDKELKALASRCRHELRMAVLQGHKKLVQDYWGLLGELRGRDLTTRLIYFLSAVRLECAVQGIYRLTR